MSARTLLRSLAAPLVALTAVLITIVIIPATSAQAASQGPYTLRPFANFGLCAQPVNESLANLTKVELVPCDTSKGAQKWWFRDSTADPGAYLIVNGASHTCLNVTNAGGAGTPLVIYTCSDESTRKNDIFRTIPDSVTGNGQDWYHLEEQEKYGCVYTTGNLYNDLTTSTTSGCAARSTAWTWVAA